MSSESNPDWRPTGTLDVLRQRAELLKQLRAFFDARAFWEVETPLLSRDTVVDQHIEPLALESGQILGGRQADSRAFLQTSPEFHMKRLLSAGADRIFQVTRAFRDGEVGSHHNPEFTMVEWYCCTHDYDAAIDMLGALAEELIGHGAAEVQTYRDLFGAFVGLDPHAASAEQLRDAAIERSVPIPSSMSSSGDVDEWLFLLLTHVIEPQLGRPRPLIVKDYPASQSALARVELDSTDTPVARRFELYFQGLELANGYDELTDPDELRRRNQQINQRRESPLPERSRLLDAMDAGLPRSCGVALGFDRLCLCAFERERIEEVIPFPWPRA